MLSRTSYSGDGWSADIEDGESTITLALLIVAMGAPVAAVITLPKQNAESALQVFADTIYVESLVLGAAVKAHLDLFRRVVRRKHGEVRRRG